MLEFLGFSYDISDIFFIYFYLLWKIMLIYYLLHLKHNMNREIGISM